MAAWTLTRALECLDVLPPGRRHELLDTLDIRRPDLERWQHVSRKLRLCWTDDGVLLQFRGYETLEEFDWAGYRQRYGDISRLDRILEAEGDSTNRYKVSKQADVLMLFQLLTADELYGLLDRLGYPHDRRTIPRTVAYYLDRTCHGSTLSKVVHSWVLARADRRKAWDYFLEALESDIADVQGGTTGEGIHLGAMAGTVDLLRARVHRPGDARRTSWASTRTCPTRSRACGSGCATGGTPRSRWPSTTRPCRSAAPAIRSTVLPVRVRDKEFRLRPAGHASRSPSAVVATEPRPHRTEGRRSACHGTGGPGGGPAPPA